VKVGASVLVLLAASTVAPALNSAQPALMPWPAKVTMAAGELPVTPGFSVRATRFRDARLEAAIRRFTDRLSLSTGVPFVTPAAGGHGLQIECSASGPAIPELGEDEAYRLDVAPSGAKLTAATVTGALRGLETLLQMASPDARGYHFPAVQIEDRPRFAWRGLMLDVSRHWMPLPVVLRNLDGMAAVKLNVLHWHLSDDQGFRVESKRYPKLQSLGSDGHYYTQDEVRQVIAYAADRGIRVVPEFDMPGHTTAWFTGYPEFASAPGPYAVERDWGIFKPTLDPSREATYQFVEGLLGELTALFPDRFFHIGGDEVDPEQWNQSAAVQAFAKQHGLATPAAIQEHFNRRLQAILKMRGKTMTGWDEILAPDLPHDAVVQSWRGQSSLAEAARKGYRSVLSFGYYLNYLQPASQLYANDPLDGDAEALNTAQAALILGGESCMWSEYVSQETVDAVIWPRVAAIAERLWSPRETRDAESMYTRMEAVSRTLEYTGLTHRSGPERELDRLAKGSDPEPLRVLVRAIEAQGHDPRAAARHYTSLVPLNRLVDAATAESEFIRALEKSAHRAAEGNAGDREFLRRSFALWKSNRKPLDALIAANPALQEIGPVADAVAEAGALGLEVLDYLQGGRPASEDWIAKRKAALDRCAQPRAEVVIAAVRPVRLLLDAIELRSRGGGKSSEGANAVRGN
jgi:hexosaminidase